MADFIIHGQSGDTFAMLANLYTIGGEAYAPALAIAAGYSPDAETLLSSTDITLPTTFIKPTFLMGTTGAPVRNPLTVEVRGGGYSVSPSTPMLPKTGISPVIYGLIALAALFLLMPQKKRAPVRRRRAAK